MTRQGAVKGTNSSLNPQPPEELLFFMNKVVQSLLGFKDRRSPILEARNSLLKLLLVFLPFNIVLFLLVNAEVPNPYMDEYFHEDQLAHYMNNDFKYWNNKITTPPGLYYFNYVLSWFNLFITHHLILARFLNVFLCSNITLVFFMKTFEYNDINANNLTRSLSLALTPTILFFNFLMYTDSLSLMFITMAFYYNLTNSRKRLFLCSLGALLTRQNNIVWMAYLVAYRIIVDKNKLFVSNRTVFTHIFTMVKIVFTQKAYFIKQFKYQVLLVIGSVLFVRKYNNGKLVFGDADNHQVSFHPTQILYLSMFLVLNLPLTFNEYITNFSTVVRRILHSRHALSTYLFLLSLSLILVDKYTIVHPFILADNRHYIFYIYKNFIARNLFRYGAALVYPLCIIFVFRVIVKSQETLLKFVLLSVCSVGVLAVTPLVQLRYFTIPLVLFSFQIKNTKHNMDIEGVHGKQTFGLVDKMSPLLLLKVVFNLGIFYVFLYRPFGENRESRFMW